MGGQRLVWPWVGLTMSEAMALSKPLKSLFLSIGHDIFDLFSHFQGIIAG